MSFEDIASGGGIDEQLGPSDLVARRNLEAQRNHFLQGGSSLSEVAARHNLDAQRKHFLQGGASGQTSSERGIAETVFDGKLVMVDREQKSKTKPQPNVDAKKMFVSLFGCFLRHNAKTKYNFSHYSQNEKYLLFKGDHGRDGIGLVFKLILLALDNKFPEIKVRDFFEIPKNRRINDKNAIKFKNTQNSVTSDIKKNVNEIVNNFGKRLIKVVLDSNDEDLIFYSPTLDTLEEDSSKQVLYRVLSHYEVNTKSFPASKMKKLTENVVEMWDTFYDTKIKGKTNDELNDIDLFGGAEKQLTQRKRREGNPWPSPFFLPSFAATVADIDSIDNEYSCRDLVRKINAEEGKNHFKHTLQNINRGVNQMYEGTMTARWDNTKKKCQIELNYDDAKKFVSFSGEGGLVSFTRQSAKFVWKNGKPKWFEDALNIYEIRKQNNKKRTLDEMEAVMALSQLRQAISVREDVEPLDELIDDEEITIRDYFKPGWSYDFKRSLARHTKVKDKL